MARHRESDWNLPDPCDTWEQVNTALLMDIRDRLAPLRCAEFRSIPSILRRISSNTAKPRRRRGWTAADHHRVLRRRRQL